MRWIDYKKENNSRIKLINGYFSYLLKVVIIISVLKMSGVLDSFIHTSGYNVKDIALIVMLLIVFSFAWYLTLPVNSKKRD